MALTEMWVSFIMFRSTKMTSNWFFSNKWKVDKPIVKNTVTGQINKDVESEKWDIVKISYHWWKINYAWVIRLMVLQTAYSSIGSINY